MRRPPPRSHLGPLAPLALLLAATLIACSAPVQPHGPVSATITPDGGVISARDERGARLTITFPDLAVADATEITLTPLPPEGAAWARFRLEPAGLRTFRELRYRLTPPDGVATTEASALIFGDGEGGEGVTLSRGVLEGGDLAADIALLGAAPDSLTTQQAEGGTSDLIALETTCGVILDALRNHLALVENPPAGLTVVNARSIAAEFRIVRELCEDFLASDETLQLELEALQTMACEGYRGALINAEVTLVDSRSELASVVVPLLNWGAAFNAAGEPTESCSPSPDPGDLFPTVAEKIGQYAAWFRDRVGSPDYTEDYLEIWRDMVRGINLQADASLLGVDLLGAAVVTTLNSLGGDLLDALRAAAYRACLEDQAHQYLADIVTAGEIVARPLETDEATALARRSLAPQQELVPTLPGFGDNDALLEDLRLCGASVTATPALDAQTFAGATVAGGATPGDHGAKPEITAPASGLLQLSGTVPAIWCSPPNGTAGFTDETLVVALDGDTVATLQHDEGRFLTSPLDIELSQVLAPTSDPTTHLLTIERSGERCAAYPAGVAGTLFEIDVVGDPEPTLEAGGAAPETFAAGPDFTSVTLTMPFQDRGENLQALTLVTSLPDTSTVQPARVIALDDLGTNPQEGVSGFGGGAGTGTITLSVRVGCDREAEGDGLLRFALTLTDDFGQISAAAAFDLPLDYGSCGGGA